MSRVARVVTWSGCAAVELVDGDTRVIVVPELGMLVAAFVVDGFDHIARPGGVAAVRRGHTSAVPLLHPWANRLARRSYEAAGRAVSLRGQTVHTDGNGLPMHGTMIARPEWEIASLARGRVRARYDFGEDPIQLASFPFPHELTVSVAVGRRRVRVTTEVQASAGDAVPISFGWHPYWRVPGPRPAWSVAVPASARGRLDRRGIPTGWADPEPAHSISPARDEPDDLYAFLGERVVSVAGRGRKLTLRTDASYPYFQVYSPRAASFCCVEPMTAPTNALVTGDHRTAPAGSTFAATFTATVR